MENVTHLLDLSLLEEEFSGLEPVGERKPGEDEPPCCVGGCVGVKVVVVPAYIHVDVTQD